MRIVIGRGTRSSSARLAESKLKARFARRNETLDCENLGWLSELVPLIPQPSRDIQAADEQAIFDRIDTAKAHPEGRRTKYFGAGSSGGYFFGTGEPGRPSNLLTQCTAYPPDEPPFQASFLVTPVG